MFPSDNSINPFEPIMFKKPSNFHLDDEVQNPIISSKQEDGHDPPFFFNLPSPFFDEYELPLNHLLSQNHLISLNHNVADLVENKRSETSTKRKKNKEKTADQPNGTMRRGNLGPIPRKRTGKKDRHSKICTAQGVRDRRMRLSLQVARKFFDLQDMLGYDKASKTIEWLFSKSKNAIKELEKDPLQANNISFSDARSESFVSECVVVSGIEESSINGEKSETKLRKPVSKPNTRESLDEARARARRRTREKMLLKSLEKSPNKIQKSGFWDTDQELNSQDREIRVSTYGASSTDYPLPGQQLDDVGIIEKFLGNSISSDYNYHCSSAVAAPGCMDPNSANLMEFLGNWDLLSNERINTSHYAVTTQVSLAGNINSIYNSGTQQSFPLFDR